MALNSLCTNQRAENNSWGWMLFFSWLSSAAAALPHTPHTTDRQTDGLGPGRGWVGGRWGPVGLRWSRWDWSGCVLECLCGEGGYYNIVRLHSQPSRAETSHYKPLAVILICLASLEKTCFPTRMSACSRTHSPNFPAAVNPGTTNRSC